MGVHKVDDARHFVRTDGKRNVGYDDMHDIPPEGL